MKINKNNNNLEMEIKKIKEIKEIINNNDLKSRAEKIIEYINKINSKNDELGKKVAEVEQINGDIGSNKESLKNEVKEIKEFVNKNKLNNDKNIRDFIEKTNEIIKIINKITDDKCFPYELPRRIIKALPYGVSAINEKGTVEELIKIFATAASGGAAGLVSCDKNDNRSLEFFKSSATWIADVIPGALMDYIEGDNASTACRWGFNAARMLLTSVLIVITKYFAPYIYEKCISPLCCKKSETTNSNNISEGQIVNTNK